MLFEAIIGGILIGWLLKGSLHNLAGVKLAGWPLILLSLALQTTILIDFHHYPLYPDSFYPIFYILSFLLLIAFSLLQKRQIGSIMIGLGLLLNLIVIAANQGTMPVALNNLPEITIAELTSGESSPFHSGMSDQTLFRQLGDWIPHLYKTNCLLSIGDLVLAAGVTVFTVQSMLAPPRKTRKAT